MMMSEFIDRTGFEPTAKEYAKIEEAYYDFDGDKDAFCKAFVKERGARKLCKARAAEIDRLNSLLLESERQYKKDMADREKRIDELTAELDRELEWKPSDGTGTNMSQNDYARLADCGKTMTAGELINFLAQYDEDTPIYLSFDNGYTYGGITEERFEEDYGEDKDDE